MLGIVQDRLAGRPQLGVLSERVASVRVAIPAREVAGSYLQADAVTGLEDVAGGPQVDVEGVRLPGFEQRLRQTVSIPRANNAVGEIERAAVRVDVHQPRHEVGVRRRRAGPQLDVDGTRHLRVALQRSGGVCQDVGSSLDAALVERPGLELRGHQQSTAMRGDRVGRIVGIAVWLLGAGRLLAQATVGAQIELRRRGASQWPLLLVAPDVGAHHEQSDGWLRQNARVDALEPVIEPAQLQAIQIGLKIDEARLRGEAEVQVADRTAIVGVRPGSDQQLAWSTLLTHGIKVGDRVRQEDVVPTTDVEARDLNPVVLASDPYGLESIGVHRVLDTIEQHRHHRLSTQRSELGQRQGCVAGRSKLVDLARQRRESGTHALQVAAVLARQHIEAHLQAPVGRGAQLECATTKREPVERFAPRDERDCGFQRRRLVERRAPLGKAEVRQSVHAHLTIGVGQPGGPGDGVDAVLGLRFERAEFTLGGQATARVLDNDDVAVARSLYGIKRGACTRQVLAIRQTGQQYGPAPLRWPIDVGPQAAAVAHGSRYVEVDDNAVVSPWMTIVARGGGV